MGSVEFLLWLRDTSYVTWVRESTSLLGYTLYLALHTIGLVFLVGPNLLIAARILGVAPRLPLSPMRSYVPIMFLGLAITVVTGSVLFATAPDGFVKNGVFLTKILFVALAIVALVPLIRELYGAGADPDAKPLTIRARVLTAATVAFWTVAVIAGRLTAYSAGTVFETVLVVAALAVVLGIVVVARRAQLHRAASQRAAFGMHTAVKGGE